MLGSDFRSGYRSYVGLFSLQIIAWREKQALREQAKEWQNRGGGKAHQAVDVSERFARWRGQELPVCILGYAPASWQAL